HVLRYARIIGHEIHQALLVGAVFVDDFTPPLVRCLGVVVVVADVVGAERPVVVGVGLLIGDGVELGKHLTPAGVEDPQQQFILLGIVALGPRERHAVLRLVGEAHAEAIRLNPAVGAAVLARRFGTDPRQQSAAGI